MSGWPNPVEPPDTDSMQQAFDRITDAVFALDEDLRFTFLNERAEEFLGGDAESLRGERIWEAHPEAEGSALHDAFREALETQESVESELHYGPLDRWVRTRVYPSKTGLSVYLHDITDLKEREQELDFRTALLEAQAEATIDGYLVVDRDRNILYYNRRFTELWDIPEEVLAERSDERAIEYVLDMLADPEEFLDKVEYLYENPEAESRDEIRLADGRWFDRYTAPVVGDNGTYYGRLWTFRDVTERKVRERRLQTMMDNVPGMVYRCRNERGWPMEFVSEGCQELTGYDPAALERGEVSYGADVVFEEDREELWEDVQRGLEEDGSFFVTYRITTSEEEVRWVQERGRGVYDENGTLVSLEGVIIDITERKRLEAELEEIYGRVTDAFYALDEEFRFTYVNDRAEDLLQATEEELLGENLWERFPEAAEMEEIWDAFHAAMEEQQPQSLELYYDPLEFWVEARVYPSETGVSVYFRDITERKEYERRLEESNERLEQFAHAVSHDLKEPLRMVSSYVQLLERRYGDEFDEDGREFVEFAADGAERMKTMIDGLLEYSRVQTRGDPFEPVDLEEILADVREDLRVKIEESEAEIDVDDLPRVEGDPSQLRQVFQNLVENAIEYSGDEPPQIHVSAARDGDEWVVSVRDRGIGVDPDDQERIFEVFERLHAPDEREGTGMGLALCRRIVERHGGDIWVESEPGEESTFYLTLPTVSDRRR